MRLLVPALYEGREAALSWSGVAPGAAVKLERVVNGLFSSMTQGLSWNEQDINAKIWALKDTLGLTFAAIDAMSQSETLLSSAAGGFTDRIPIGAAYLEYKITAGGVSVLSGRQNVIRNSPPVISGSNRHLGSRFMAFSVPFSVTDSFSGTLLTIKALLGSTQIFYDTGLAAPYSGTVSITADRIAPLAVGSQHTLTITATDGEGGSSTRLFTFKKVNSPFSYMDFYLLRDGRPVAKLTESMSYTDYTTLGEHAYTVRGVDKNGTIGDSNTVRVSSSVEYATLATAAAPEDMLALKIRKDELPRHENEYSANRKFLYFEGREHAVFEEDMGREAVLKVTYSLRERGEYEKLLNMFYSGEVLWYRDQLGVSAAVCIRKLPARLSYESREITLEMVQLDFTGEVSYD